MKTAAECLAEEGRSFPEPDENGCTSLEQYQAAGIAMIVRCGYCDMSMAFRPTTMIDDEGWIICNGCVKENS